MKSTKPFISIVIPTYNSEKYIVETLKSVFSQTYENYEVIVSDDGSSDSTVGIVKSIFNKSPSKKSVLLLNSHVGPGAARNKGIGAADGEWISFLDSDDRWFSQKLKKVVDYIYHNPEINLVCHSEIWQKSTRVILLNHSKKYNKQINPFLSLYRDNALSTSAVTIKKELLMNVGLFDITLPSAQDYDLWLRLAMIPSVKIGYIEEPLGIYISRDKSISSNIEQRLYCYLKISKKNINNLKQVCKLPRIEKLRFEGRAYASAGKNLIRNIKLKKSIKEITNYLRCRPCI